MARGRPLDPPSEAAAIYPVAVMVIRAQATSNGMRIRLSSTFDVERSPQVAAKVYDQLEPAISEITSWLIRCRPEPM